MVKITRPHPFSFRMSDHEHEAMSSLVEKIGIPRQDVLRNLIRDKAMVLGVWPPELEPETEPENEPA